MIIPELLSPAGSLKSMRYAFAYGADSVYAGQPRYSMRVKNNEFNYENLKIGIEEAHKIGKKFYVVMNIIPHNNKIISFINDLKNIIKIKPDALIISDPGLIMLTKEKFPDTKIHLSVQANTINWASVKFWKKIGLKRIILSRELSIEEINEIREKVPDIELEVFIHGSLCIAYSGRCLLSNYINKRDANQGTCTNTCRWKFNIKNKENEKKKNKNTIERKFSISEDKHGSYILNSKDLRAIKYIKRLINIGINSFKIEGRTKSFYYCARTTQSYRKAINDAIKNKPFDVKLLHSLNELSNRGYTEGFLNRNEKENQNYKYSSSINKKKQFVGEFTGKYKNNLAEIIVKNKFCIGDHLELITPKKNIKFILDKLEDTKQQSIQLAPGSGYIVFLKIPEKIKLNFGLLVKNIKNHK